MDQLIIQGSKSDCLVCRDYHDIDDFAATFQLSNVQSLLEKYGLPDFKYDQAKVASFSKQIAAQQVKEKDQWSKLTAEELFERATTLQLKESQLSAEIEDYEKKSNKIAKELDTETDFNYLAYVTERARFYQDTLGEMRVAYSDCKTERETLMLSINKGLGDLQASAESLDNFMKTNQDQVDAVARALWRGCVLSNTLNIKDHVGRARLFFTWTAISLKYDLKVLKFKQQKLMTSADALGLQYAVCLDFAHVFKTFSNAIIKYHNAEIGVSDKFLAIDIVGFTKQSSRREKLPVKGADKHAWNAFPLEEDTEGNITKWKLIDSTWGRGGENYKLNAPWWFTKSNEAFQRDHVPDVDQQQCVPKIMTLKSAFEQDLVDLTWLGDEFHIDPASLSLPQAIIHLQPITSKQFAAFTFRMDCPHRKLERSVFMAVCLKGQTKVDTGRLSLFSLVQGTWSTKLDVTGCPSDGTRTARMITPYYLKPTALPFRKILDFSRPVVFDNEEAVKSFKEEFGWAKLAEWEIGVVGPAIGSYEDLWVATAMETGYYF